MSDDRESGGGFDPDWLALAMTLRPRPPAGQRGDLRLTVETIPRGEPFVVVSLRNAIFSGQRPASCELDWPVEIRSLSYEGGQWMRDDPQEVWQMHGPLEELRAMDEPRLLVGGLGLGVFSHLADAMAGAIVTTVERDDRVIDLVAAWSTREVLRADIRAVAQTLEPDEYNAAFLDTWQSTGEHCWCHEVVPLRRRLADKIEHLWCWQEQEMAGQIRLNGFRAMCVPVQSIPPGSPHYRVLRQAAERAGVAPAAAMPRGMKQRWAWVQDRAAELAQEPEAAGIMERLLSEPGSAAWEAEFGELWDRAAREDAKRGGTAH